MFRPVSITLCAAALAGLGVDAWAQSEPSEVRVAVGRLQQVEAELVRERKAGEALGTALAQSRAELETAAAELTKLRQAEAARAVTAGSPDAIKERLLTAISDLRLSEQQRAAVEARLHELTAAVVAALSAPEAERTALLAEVRRLTETAATPAPTGFKATPRLDESQVISVQPELNLVVLNAGADAGLRLGTPVKVLRDERPIASALLVDVRAGHSGAVLVNRTAEPRVGDRLQIESTN